MSWLATGQVFGAVMGFVGHENSSFVADKNFYIQDEAGAILVTFFLVMLSAAIGGFVIVGLMIKQFGSCTLV
jgi:hypothetical protein